VTDTPQPTTAAVGPSPPVPSIRSVVPGLVIDGLCPYVTYKFLMAYAPSVSEIGALGLGALFPAGHGLVSLVYRRRIDIIGAIVLVGIAVSILALLLGGSPKLFLIRESFVTGAVGLLALVSLMWRRPLLFYIGRQFSAGDDAAAIEQFNSLWQRPPARRLFRLLTVVWAVGWLLEFAIRVVIVLMLSVAQVLAISPFIFNGITLGLVAWTLAYVRQQRARAVRGQSPSDPTPLSP